MEKINVGLIGFGTVGGGVARALIEKAAHIERLVGAKVSLKVICDNNLRKKRAVKVNRKILTNDINKVIGNPDIDIVVELIGGIHPAKEFVLKAIKSGQHIVTANKALITEHGQEIFDAASKAGVEVFYEASVGGGIPIIKAMREGLVANEIDTILGIVNGTSNYILSCMAEEGLSFSDALDQAKKKGYAERNPALDIEGYDSAHKLAILALLGFGKFVKLDDIYVEGILDISQNDIRYADEFGYAIKLLAIAKRNGKDLEVRVHPTLLSKEHLLANVNGVYNAIYVHGDMVGGTLFYGRGAGQNPAASSVVGDVIDLARNLRFNTVGRVPIYMKDRSVNRISRMDEIEASYYIRISCIDRPGILGKVAGILGRHKISIASVGQKERKKARIVPVVMMTHEAKEKDMRQAMDEIDRLAAIRRKTVAIRVER